MSNDKQILIEKAIDLIDGFLTELDDIAENHTKQSSVDNLWNMIPKETQNYIVKQFDGYEQAKAIHEMEVRFAFNEGKATILVNWINDLKPTITTHSNEPYSTNN